MSSESPSTPKPRSTPRANSLARSITLGMWVRRLVWFIFLDILIAALFTGIFLFLSFSALPVGAMVGAQLAEGVSMGVFGSPSNLWHMGLVFTLADGGVLNFPFKDVLVYAVPVLGTVVVVEVVALLVTLGDTRSIRLALKPLNDLALEAERLATTTQSVSLSDHEVAVDEKLGSLERAIGSATIESPRIQTNDQDLRSIEIALNSLLASMHEAQNRQVQFVSDVSHELRTPISVIQGYVEMLERWGKDDPQVLEESILAVMSETDNMQHLVEELLFLAKGDAGQNPLTLENFDLVALVIEVVEESRMIDDDHDYLGPASRGDYEPPTIEVKADRTMVKQAIRALVQNAARYSPAGSSVTLETREEESEVAIVVRDEGIGIAPDQISHVFDRFWRAGEARDRTTGGSGLGLAIVQWIAEAHHGRIDVVSYEGVGTRFTFVLPKANGCKEP